MALLLLALSILAAAATNLLLHALPLQTKENLFLYNLFCSGVWLALLASLCAGDLAFTRNELFFGGLCGLLQTAFLLCKSGAMSTGPVSVTTLVGNCSLLLSTIAGVLLWQEQVGIGQGIGIALLCVAVFLCTFRSGSSTTHRKSWPFFCVGFLLTAAGVGLLFKAFQKAGGGDSSRMLFCCAAVMLPCMFACALFTHAFTKSTLPVRRRLLPILLSGILSCLYNRLNISLAGALPSVLFYPIFNGGIILLCALCGRVLFREKNSPSGLLGLLLGLAAIVIIGIS